MASDDSSLMGLLRAIGAKDLRKAAERLRATPHLARVSVDIGARRKDAKPYYFERINHYVYAGDTALHLAASAYAPDLVRMLLDRAQMSAPGTVELPSRWTTPPTVFPARTVGILVVRRR